MDQEVFSTTPSISPTTLSGASLTAPLDEIERLYRAGYYLDAYHILRTFDEATLRNVPEALIATGQVAGMTGNRRLRAACYRRAWQLAKHSSEALYYYTRGVLLQRGTYAALEIIERYGNAIDLESPLWLGLRAYLAADLRDFHTATPLMARALEEQPDDPWLHVEHAYQLEYADQYDAALSAVERALQLQPWFRPAVQQRAKLLTLHGGDDEAYRTLQEATAHMQSEAVLAQLFAMQMERKEYSAARTTLQQIDPLTPLKDKHYRTWLAISNGDVAYALGEIDAAIHFAREAGTPFQQGLAATLTRSAGKAPQRLLDVHFVRQHHNTCGPATMSALTRYFGADHDQSSLVEAIWYNGTTAYDERRWGEENGWLVREFSVDWPSTVALIDRGIPFALSTQEADSAHLQAVIGYDANRDFLLIRDPYYRHSQEFSAEPFFERYRSSGPRGMIFLPPQRAELLDDITLPDAEAYDLLYALNRALQKHDRPQAVLYVTQLNDLAPGSRLALQAATILARYDRNDSALLTATRASLALFSDDIALQSSELDTLERLGDMATYIEMLRQRGESINAAPQLQLRYASFLSSDARHHTEMRQRLKRLLRRRPYQANGYATLAQLEWAAENRDEATRLYQTAANLQIDSEQYALDYFRAARYLRQTDAALAWLHERKGRYELHSANPLYALYNALSLLSREHEGIALLEETLQRRPADGELLLFTADALRDNGRFDEAARYLQQAEGAVLRSRWLASRARLMNAQSQRHEALACWREVIALEPLNMAAHRNIASLLATLEGREAAIRYADALLERYPHLQPVLELRADWFERDQPAQVLPILRHITELNPGNAWAWREQALRLQQLGDHAQALTALTHAEPLEPFSISLHQIKGDLLVDMGQLGEALDSFRYAITLSVDADYAIDRLLQLSYSSEQKRAALAFIRTELERQVVQGDGLWSYQKWAAAILEPEELLAELRHAHELRPDLWHSSSALSRQLLEMGRSTEALAVAEAGAQRFPLLPRLWIDLAHCRRICGDENGEAEALRHAIEINPEWTLPILRLSEHHERRGDYAQSRDVLRDYLQRDDSDSRIHGYLADALWHLDDLQGALHHIRKAIELSPDYSWAWERLGEWSAANGEPELALEVARQNVTQAPGNVESWRALAIQLGPCEESLEALRRAIALEPRRIETHDKLMQHLGRLGRFDEARRVADDPIWEGNTPVTLRINLPWIRYRQGMVREAIQEMRQLLEEESRYAEGWRMLAVWAENAADKEMWIEASRRYAQLLPNDAVAQSYLADALAAHEQVDEAIASYTRALQLSPDNINAALSLFDLQLESAKESDAEQTLAQLLRHHPHGTAWIDARQIQLFARHRDETATLATLRNLVRREENGQWPLDTAATALQEAGWGAQLEQELAHALHPGSSAHAAVGRAWINVLKEQRQLRRAQKRVKELFVAGEAGIEAIDALLDAMIEKEAPINLYYFIWRHRDRLRQFTLTWATIGYFYARHEEYRKVARWMADWQRREDVPPWALNNLAISLRALGRWEEAASVCSRALSGEPGNLSHQFHLWLALERGLQGDLAAMEREMEMIDLEALAQAQQYLYHLMMALHTGESLRSNDREALHAIRGHLRNGLKVHPAYASDSVLRKVRRRVMARITGAMGSFPFNLYYQWRLL